MLVQMTRHMTLARRRGACGVGLTLIELLVVLGITAALVAVALPSMNEFIARQRVLGVATELMGDLRYARSEQMRSTKAVRVAFAQNAVRTCYMVHHQAPLGAGCSCAHAARPYCRAVAGILVPTELKTVELPLTDLITVKPNAASPTSLTFDATTGRNVADDRLTIDVQSPSGGHLRVMTGAAGQPSICSVSGHSARFPACPA